MNKNQEKHLISIMERLYQIDKCGPSKTAMCARDCLYQDIEGGKHLLNETLDAWDGYIDDVLANRGTTETERHGAWVPAIPL
jgi:hypothetical protein